MFSHFVLQWHDYALDGLYFLASYLFCYSISMSTIALITVKNHINNLKNFLSTLYQHDEPLTFPHTLLHTLLNKDTEEYKLIYYYFHQMNLQIKKIKISENTEYKKHLISHLEQAIIHARKGHLACFFNALNWLYFVITPVIMLSIFMILVSWSSALLHPESLVSLHSPALGLLKPTFVLIMITLPALLSLKIITYFLEKNLAYYQAELNDLESRLLDNLNYQTYAKPPIKIQFEKSFVQGMQ
jgi:hypothetical protein